jgi:uncharacterized protein (DUF169 family)
MSVDSTIRVHLGTKYNLIGIKVRKEDASDSELRPPKKMRFCELVREAADGKSFEAVVEDMLCPHETVVLGFEEPEYVDVQPRISPAETKTVCVAPLDEMKDPDVVLAILNPKQTMDVSALLNGLEASFSGNLAICGEAMAKPYMDKKPNLTFLCGGARTFADYKDSELILGAPPETFKELAEKIEALSKTCGALCGCRTSDIPPRIVKSFQKLGFEKGTDYFFGRVDGQNVRIYLNKDFQGKFRFITFHLPLKREVKLKSPFLVRKRGDWTDVVVTFGLKEGIDIHTGKGIPEALQSILEKVKASE